MAVSSHVVPEHMLLGGHRRVDTDSYRRFLADLLQKPATGRLRRGDWKGERRRAAIEGSGLRAEKNVCSVWALTSPSPTPMTGYPKHKAFNCNPG